MNRESAPNDPVVVRLQVREAGHVAFLTVNNPEKRNALGIAGKKALTEAFKQLARDEAVDGRFSCPQEKREGVTWWCVT